MLARDVLPAIRSEVRKLKRPLKTWRAGFLTKAILKARDQQLAGASYAPHRGSAAPNGGGGLVSGQGSGRLRASLERESGPLRVPIPTSPVVWRRLTSSTESRDKLHIRPHAA